MRKRVLFTLINTLLIGSGAFLYGNEWSWKKLEIGRRAVVDAVFDEAGMIVACGTGDPQDEFPALWMGRFERSGRVIWTNRSGSSGVCIGIHAKQKDGLLFAANEKSAKRIFGFDNPNWGSGFRGIVGGMTVYGAPSWISSIRVDGLVSSDHFDGGFSGLSVTPNGSLIVGGSVVNYLDDHAPNTGLLFRSTGFVSAVGGKEGWTTKLENLEFSRVSGVAIGKDGTIYASGWARGDVHFRNLEEKNSKKSLPFVGAFDSRGRLKWLETFGGGQADRRALSVGVALDGSVVVSGLSGESFPEGFSANNFTETRSLFLAVFHESGELRYMTESSGPGQVGFGGVSVLPSGECFVAGTVAGKCRFGDRSLELKRDHAFLCRVGKGGQFKELITMESEYNTYGVGVHWSENREILFWGHVFGEAKFGGVSLQGPGDFLVGRLRGD